jgi:acyl dehydratase
MISVGHDLVTEYRGCRCRKGELVIRFPIEEGHVLMFARSVGDPNPIYKDAGYAAHSDVGRLIAPPTFVTSSTQFDPDFSLRPGIGKPWIGSGREVTGVASKPENRERGTGLHAEQHYEYFRPFGPGDTLFATPRSGESWQREGRRGGTLTFTEFFVDYRDAEGELVVTSRAVAVRTSKNVGTA